MAPSPSETLTALQAGQISARGKFLWGSNYTFLVELQHQEQTWPAVYKPTRGERPLWDFPTASLAGREVAAHVLSEALGWNLVPPTVYRDDGPQGPGSLQLFIEHDPEYHYFCFNDEDVQRLRPVALFDLVANNADRKGSHVLVDPERRIWLIDHGICFHAEPKLRTVIWDFAGEAIPDELCSDIARFVEGYRQNETLQEAFGHYLNPREQGAMLARAESLLASGKFPNPRPNHRPYPWPPV